MIQMLVPIRFDVKICLISKIYRKPERTHEKKSQTKMLDSAIAAYLYANVTEEPTCAHVGVEDIYTLEN